MFKNTSPPCTLCLRNVWWIGEPLGRTANGLLRLSVLTESDGEEQTRHMPENTGSSLVTIRLAEEESHAHPSIHLHTHAEFERVSKVAGHMFSKVHYPTHVGSLVMGRVMSLLDRIGQCHSRWQLLSRLAEIRNDLNQGQVLETLH